MAEFIGHPWACGPIISNHALPGAWGRDSLHRMALDWGEERVCPAMKQ